MAAGAPSATSSGTALSRSGGALLDLPSGEDFASSVALSIDARDWSRVRWLCERRKLEAPEDPEAHRHLGQLLLAEGALSAAQDSAEKATVLAPNDPRAWSDLGCVLIARDKQRKARDCFRRAVDLDNAYADGWHNLGLTLKRLGRADEAFKALQTAVGIDPTRANSWIALGNLLFEAGQAIDAVGCFERAVKYDMEDQQAAIRLARAHISTGDVARAEALLVRAAAADPRNVEVWLALGEAREIGGGAGDALDCYRQALSLAPNHPMALGRALALMPRDAAAGDLTDRATIRMAAPEMKDEARALIGYGLAKHHDRRENYSAAAEAGSRANAARRRATGVLDRANLKTRVDGIIEQYTANFFASRRVYGVGTDRPIFIVGLPRSGTTLVEQILSAHPLLHGAGELPDLAQLALRHRADKKHAPWRTAEALDTVQSRQAAHNYLAALTRGAPRRALRISDKSPLNFFHLAFAALLFPNARVIHCMRGLQDNALSIWLENFSADQHWSTDFADLAYFTGQYRRLMAHWDAEIPLPILDVAYEDTVTDLEGQARRLLAFLGVPWDARCLNFHGSGRAVNTPSRWQVRQPIYTRSVGRWKQYAEYLPELKQAFPESGE